MQRLRRKKTLLIFIVVAITTSAITFGVIAFMNSPKMKLASIIQKIPKIEKGEGTYSIAASVYLPEGDIEVGINDGSLILTRKFEERDSEVTNFLNAKGTVVAKATEQSQLRLAAKYINEEKGELMLTNQYILKSSFLNKQSEYQVEDSLKIVLSKIFVGSINQTADNKDTLQAFVLSGYEPLISEEQNKAVITITKSEIFKMLRKVEENVRANRQKFAELVQKQYPQIPNNQIELLTSGIINGEFSKRIEDVFSQVTDFYFKIMFEETKNNTIDISTELRCDGTITVFDKKTTIKFFCQTAMNYKVLA